MNGLDDAQTKKVPIKNHLNEGYKRSCNGDDTCRQSGGICLMQLASISRGKDG
jgi:hypothetical protein